MDIFNVLELLGGLAIFLFGMHVLGNSLEKKAGGSLKTILSKTTTGRLSGFLLGTGVTAVIQSSSATTVMVVGFVNSGLMNLRQAINVIIGANVGTTITAWILSLTGIEGGTMWLQMLKPSSWTPILAIVGIGLLMFTKKNSKHDTGMILLGFAVLMFGMDAMSGAVSGLRDVPEFQQMMVMFSNPVLGVLVGALLTGIIQSSSASVGILQALSATGQIPFSTAFPVILGMNIGTCVTALLAAIGSNKNGRRAAFFHLSFNIIGTAFWLIVVYVADMIFDFAIMDMAASEFTIAIMHTTFKLLFVALLMPMAGLLERLACYCIKDKEERDPEAIVLDDHLLATPAIALETCRQAAHKMADIATSSFVSAISCIREYNPTLAEEIRKQEDRVDQYEDAIGDYLLKISNCDLTDKDNVDAAKLLHIIGDFERISDHAVNILESAEEMHDKDLQFSAEARAELEVMMNALDDIITMAHDAFVNNDAELPILIEPLEQVVDTLKEQLRMRHILRLQRGTCTIELGFIWSDLLTNLERVSDHCSNIGCCVLETNYGVGEAHHSIHAIQFSDQAFVDNYKHYSNKYALVTPDGNRVVNPGLPESDYEVE